MSGLQGLDLGGRRRLPMFVATEAAECGLACLAMVSHFHGHDVDLNGLRQRHSFSTAGVTLRGLMAVADHLDLSGRPMKVDLDMLHRVETPAILHWDMQHFVVLHSISRSRVVVHDPAIGIRRMSLSELSKHYTGVVLELRPSATFMPIVARAPVSLSSLWTHVQGAWVAALQVVGLSAALQALTFAAPFQVQLVIDQAVARGDVDLLVVLALGFGGLSILQAATEGLRSWSIAIFGNILTFQMVGNLVRHLLRLPIAFFERRHLGDILSRIGSSNAIQEALTQGVVSGVLDGVMALLAIVILFIYSPTLALVVLVGVAITVTITWAIYPLHRARVEEHLIAAAAEQSILMESIRAISTIKLMGKEVEREGLWRDRYASVINRQLSLSKVTIASICSQNIISGIQTVIVIFLAGKHIVEGRGFSIGMLFAFLSFRQTFTDRVTSLVNQVFQLRMLGLHLERLGDIVTVAPEAAGGSVNFDLKGALELKGVAFRYGATDPMVLKGVDLQIEAGEFLAITGASGSGKTTLLKILLGLYAPVEGGVVLDGNPATAELWRAWRAQIGVVAQDDQLLSGTIADNIAFFDAETDIARVHEAAAAAQIHDDIMRMPMQYWSLIGDMGSSLSGGQRQRILLARALYRRPRLLILDEGTANLDEATEAAIGDVVAAMDITRIVVAHRPALLVRADRVVGVENGQITGVQAQAPLTAKAS